MKMMKWALLGGAAVAVLSTSAQADELDALKAQLETLQARVTQLEAQPATSMPSGYSLLSIRDGQGVYGGFPEKYSDRPDPDQGFTISVLPTADVAPAAEISVSGEVRTILFYRDFDNAGGFGINDDSGADVRARGRLRVDGKVDTAVGEVGGRIRLEANVFDDGDGDTAHMHDANFYWKFAPNWQLLTGYTDTLAAVQAGPDWLFTFCGFSCGGPSDKLNEQMGLKYESGPFSLVVALEDSDFGATPDRGDIPAALGYLMYNADAIMFQVVGVWQEDDVGDEDDFGIGAGTILGLGDMFQFTAAATYSDGYAGWANDFVPDFDDELFMASAGLIFNLAENTRFELGYGFADLNDDTGNNNFEGTAHVVNAGVYWDPVSQVTLGLQANGRHAEIDGANNNVDRTDWMFTFATWLRFP